MALTASSIIEEAEGLAYPDIGENATARGPLLHQLTSLEKEVAGMVVATSPNLLATPGTAITIVLATNPNGYALDTDPRAYLTNTFKYVSSEGNIYPIRIVPLSDFTHPPVHPAGIVRNGSFFPCDPLGKDWDGTDARSWYKGDGDTVTHDRLDEPAAVTTLSQALASPDLARPYFAHSLALSILLASGTASELRLQQMTAAVMNMREGIPMLLALRARVESSIATSRDYGETE